MFSSLAPSLALKASQTLTRHKAPTGSTLTSRKQQIKDTLLGLSAGSLALLICLAHWAWAQGIRFCHEPQNMYGSLGVLAPKQMFVREKRAKSTLLQHQRTFYQAKMCEACPLCPMPPPRPIDPFDSPN